MIRITLIGGFGFNVEPLKFLYSQMGHDVAIRFVDINLFPATVTLNDMSDYVLNTVNENDKDDCYPGLSPRSTTDNVNSRFHGNDKEKYGDNQGYDVDVICKTSRTNANILIAYSMGGLVAIDAALKAPDKFTKIILINSTPKFIAADNWDGIKSSDFQKLQNKLENSSIEDFMKYFTSLVAFPERIRDWNRYSSWWSNTAKGQLQNLLQILFMVDFRNEIYQLHEKIVMINAKNDVLVKNNNLDLESYWCDNSSHLKIDNASRIILQTINR